MNVLIEKLSIELKKNNLGVNVKKETSTKFDCYLYDLSDYVMCGCICDYRNCKKLDTTYKKSDLATLIANNTLKSFAESEKKTFDMANIINALRI